VRAILSRLSLASDVCVLILLTPLRFDSLLITIVRTASGYCGRDVTACNNFNAIADRGLDRHKKEPPGSPRSRGLCRLLPQLVGSFDPGGGCRGMGCRPGRAYQFKFLDTKPLKDYATDRAAVSTSRSFSAASFFQCLAIRSKNFRSSALLAFEAYHSH
jgi:hypothetical protein